MWYSSTEDSNLVKKEETIVGVNSTKVNIDQITSLQGVHKGLIMGKSEEIDRMQKELSVKYSDLDFVKSSPTLLEVVLKGVSKKSAIELVAQEYGVELKDCIAFGDNFNDVAMLQTAGIGVAMANAPQPVKEAANIVTTDNNHNGIQLTLAQYFADVTR